MLSIIVTNMNLTAPMTRPTICRLIALLAAGFVSAAQAQSAGPIRISPDQLAKAGVVFAAVKPASTAGVGVRLAGSVVYPPNRIEIVSAPAAGVVQAVLVNSLEHVKAMQALARLHSPQLLEWQRDYVQLAAQLELATKKTERDENLFKEGIIAASRLQDTRNQLAQAQVAVQERAQMLKLAGMRQAAIATLASQHGLNPVIDIQTPRGGTVLELMVAPGQRVEAGAPLVKLARAGELWLELQASRMQGDQIAIGDTVNVRACKESGRVSAIAPQMAEQSQLVIVRATLPGADRCLRAGQYLEATISSKTVPQTGWLVPAGALVRDAGRELLFVRDAKGVRPLNVTVITRDAASAVVQGALQDGVQVAVQGTANLKGIWLGLGVPAAGAK
jgi:cobalt-zinc-cadmium efflux system membrane fusion protein